MKFIITTDYIKLDSLLKSASIAASGGVAKVMISGGKVRVNGEIELRRGRKLYPGDRINLRGIDLVVECAE